jgi:hypothetical protein
VRNLLLDDRLEHGGNVARHVHWRWHISKTCQRAVSSDVEGMNLAKTYFKEWSEK